MAAEPSCAVEGCVDAIAGDLRFIDAPDANGCRAHLGAGLILRVGLCSDHLKLALSHGGDGRWEK
jgi:hypothetical protein